MRSRLLGAAIAVVLALLSFAWVMDAQREVGLVRDELVYMHHGSRYADWWMGVLDGRDGMLSADTITRHFGGPGATSNNREHPPLMKTLFGLSERLLHRELGWLDRVSAYRAPAAAMNGLLVALVFLFAAGLWGRGVGLVAALLTLLAPRPFFHAGLATFDGAVVTMWFAVLYAYLRALASRPWCVVLGVLYGLALATKHNALMMPAVLLPHYLYLSVRRGRALQGDAPAPGVGGWLRALGRGFLDLRPSSVLACVLLGTLCFVALWPWLWFDTVAHIGDWVRFHLHHVHYNFEYLGRNWNAAPYPWHVPLVTTALTAPVITLVAALWGGALLLARRCSDWARAALPPRLTADAERILDDRASSRAPALLLALSALVAIAPFALGHSPIFGAEKHWAAIMPSVSIFAALGVFAAARAFGAAWGALRPASSSSAAAAASATAASGVTALAAAILACAAVAAAAAETVRAQPYALSYYNALAGGAPGGADLGMNRQFWGYSARGVLPELNQRAAQAGRSLPVYTHDAAPAWGRYAAEGLLAPDLPDAGHERGGVARSKLALVIHERHFLRHDYMIWDVFGTVQPVYVLTFQGVPLVSVYAR
ncbi:ArnT family glycosyltransferase [Haliangium ochraceum]|uniref:Glycosyltransferase RgtA/B/C/D-like domain-containing protein n=1 Tax=Haliangium ochraceum (strain DSM 14365 / JCM 11303 / SMP-2) TaxID=502025 RepID=D0LH01_HALO1|nr:glycosyltransferase family 39 protein [Haliangium ochraceum]ACY14723.1 conserved hypothetical protein [Haliangium ochraceum DSM 14365]